MIHIIINPAAGQNTPVLATINSILHPANLAWRVSITQKAGDAKEQAALAAAEGVDVVAVYGGDGTVVEAASGLLNTDIPLAILPGGTANVMALDLGIPLDLTRACKLLVKPAPHIRTIDVGQVNNHCFLLRVGMGAEAQITEGADRELKNRLGILAYVWSAAQSLMTVKQATYHLTIDGRSFEVEGITCGVINSGRLGLGNLKFGANIRVDDGLLDVVVIQQASLPALADFIGRVMVASEPPIELPSLAALGASQPDFSGAIQHWKGKEITVRAVPRQVVQYDGELLDAEELHCRVLPQALKVLVPRA